MRTSIAQASGNEADNKSHGRGRPWKRETAAGVEDMQTALSCLRTQGFAVSGVSGKRLGLRALAYVIWYEQAKRAALQDGRHDDRVRQAPTARGARRQTAAVERWEPPRQTPWTMPPIGLNLEKEREHAIGTVRKVLLERAHEHIERARRGEPVIALRMTDPGSNGARYVPALDETWPGLPGLYSYDWPTTVGLPGEASLELAEEAVRRGGFALVTLDAAEAEAVWRRLRDSPPDDAAVAEEVATHYGRETAQSAERKLRRLIREAQAHEYVFLGDLCTGKKRLPPTRS